MPGILVVEDEPVTAIAVSSALQDAGYWVETAWNAAEACAMLKAESRSFGALVTDVNLGDGEDGFFVAAHARALNAAVQVVYMTGNAANLAAFEPGRELMFPKPFDPDELVGQMALLLPLS